MVAGQLRATRSTRAPAISRRTSSGNLLTDTGDKVQGWTTVDPTTGEVNTNGPIGNIVVPVGSLKAPVATTSFTDDLNLNSAAAADATSDFHHAGHGLRQPGHLARPDLDFQKTGTNTWSYQVTLPGDDVSAAPPARRFAISGASGTLTFDTTTAS